MKLESLEVIHPVMLDGHSVTGLGDKAFSIIFDEPTGLVLVESRTRGGKSIIPLSNVKKFVPASGVEKPAPKK